MIVVRPVPVVRVVKGAVLPTTPLNSVSTESAILNAFEPSTVALNVTLEAVNVTFLASSSAPAYFCSPVVVTVPLLKIILPVFSDASKEFAEMPLLNVIVWPADFFTMSFLYVYTEGVGIVIASTSLPSSAP